MKNRNIITIILVVATIVYGSSEIRIDEVTHPNSGAQNGSISVYVEGDSGPFSVSINGGVSCAQSGNIFTCGNLSSGTQTLIVIDGFGCEKIFNIELFDLVCDLQVSLSDRGNVTICDNCDDSNGVGCSNDGFIEMSINATDLHLYEITWKDYVTGEETYGVHNIYNLSPHYIQLIVQHTLITDCNFTEYYQIGICEQLNSACESVTSPFAATPELFPLMPNSGCNGGFWNISWPSSDLFQYNWTFQEIGSSVIQNIDIEIPTESNLCPGIYCLDYDNGCGTLDPICYTLNECDNFSASITSNCFKENFVESDLDIVGGTGPYTISNHVSNSGVFIQIYDSNGCYTNLWSSEFEFSYNPMIDVQIVKHFDSNADDPLASGAAIVHFKSSEFQVGDVISINETGQQNINTGGMHLEFAISKVYKNIDGFSFTYTSVDGCQYEGLFVVSTCENPSQGLSFSVELVGNMGVCDELGLYDYKILIHNVGNDNPYFFKVTMDEAIDPLQSDFEKIIQYNGIDPKCVSDPIGQNPIPCFIIEGIPAGSPRFISYNKCGVVKYNTAFTKNCCGEFLCEEISRVESASFEGEQISLPFFNIISAKTCYDNPLFGQVSEILIQPHTYAPQGNCFIGNIIITHHDNVEEIIRVEENGSIVHVKKREPSFKPPTAGDYSININYFDGLCSIDIPVTWYGPSYSAEVVGFYSTLQIRKPFNYDYYFSEESYPLIYACQQCKAQNEKYIFKRNECDFENNWDAIYLRFVPDSPSDYLSEDPCSAKGSIEIIEFIDGQPTRTTVDIPENSSIASVDIHYSTEELFCPVGGWCHFDAHSLGIYLDANLEYPLFAKYWDDLSCVTWEDWDNWTLPDPCDQNSNPCDGNLICVNGACLIPCDDGSCPEGYECEILNGQEVCVPSGNPCDPECPDENWECIDGECVQDICSFYPQTVFGQGHETYEFFHDLPIGSEIVMEFRHYKKEDKFVVSGGATHTEDCTTNSDNIILTIIDDEKNIKIDYYSCFNEPESVYWFDLYCIDPLKQNNEELSSKLIETENIPKSQLILQSENNLRNTRLFPNPFENTFFVNLINFSNENIECIVYNSIGEVEYINRLKCSTNNENFKINALQCVPEGIYFVTVKTDSGFLQTHRVIKNSK